MGVPVGAHTLHMDLDLSDCGILSQKPRDFVYKGYTKRNCGKIKSSIKSQNYEIANTLWESSYKEGVKLINQNADEIDAIIIDASLEGNVLELLLGYEKESLLSKTIIIDNLKLENQLCFPLYVCSKGIISKYKEYLDEFDLTYTQYIVMLALWEAGSLNVKQLGNIICLSKYSENYLQLQKNERNVHIEVTELGFSLKEKVKKIPVAVSKCMPLSEEEKEMFGKYLYKIVNHMYNSKEKKTSSKN